MLTNEQAALLRPPPRPGPKPATPTVASAPMLLSATPRGYAAQPTGLPLPKNVRSNTVSSTRKPARK
jgi:hypothetical protein